MKKNKNWFTLIEIIVVIAIIWVLIVWASRINFNPQIDKQNSDMFTNNIFSNIETIRNNSLLWKWMWSWVKMFYPEKWVVNISKTWSWKIENFYQSWWISYNYKEININFINDFWKISEIKCRDINWNWYEIINNIDIEFSGKNITLSWCTYPNDKLLELTTNYKSFSKTIKLSKVTWLIEKK